MLRYSEVITTVEKLVVYVWFSDVVYLKFIMYLDHLKVFWNFFVVDLVVCYRILIRHSIWIIYYHKVLHVVINFVFNLHPLEVLQLIIFLKILKKLWKFYFQEVLLFLIKRRKKKNQTKIQIEKLDEDVQRRLVWDWVDVNFLLVDVWLVAVYGVLP